MKRINSITKKISVIVMSLVAVIALFAVTFTYVSDNTISYGNTVAYKSSLSEIESSDGYTNSLDLNQISISTYYNASTYGLYSSIKTYTAPTSSDVITIKNGKELDAFSKLCLADVNFLTFNYQLIDNINYAEATALGSSISFFPIGYKEASPFTGNFDGQGYEIESLVLVSLGQEHNTATYSEFIYYGMFSRNSGTIKNFGLINTDIVQAYAATYVAGIAPVVGLNTSSGTVSNVYVVDDRSAIDGDAGITAAGGHIISGFCYDNQGTIEYCYTDYAIVASYQVRDYIAFVEITYLNTGTITSTYFLDRSIDSKKTINGTEYYVFKEGLLGADYKIACSSFTGTYVASAEALNSAFNQSAFKTQGWYTSLSYSISNFNIERPLLKGFTQGASSGAPYVFYITDANDFAYMFELANKNSYFASSNVKYIVTKDIDLSRIPETSYVYDDFFGATLSGRLLTEIGTVTFINGNKTNYPTIYGATINNVINYSGFECYGLFPILEGEISNLNIYYNDLDSFSTATSSQESKAIGLVSGYVEGGKISNVNVYGNISLKTTETSPYTFGRYYVGGIAGVCARNSTISNCSSAGSIDGSTHNTTYFNTTNNTYVDGNSMGGIVGYAHSSLAILDTCLSAMSLNATNFSSNVSIDQHIGGVVGSGYLSNSTGLANKGSITIGTSSNNYGRIYAAGVIGRLLGSKGNIESLHNQGDINYTFSIAKTANLSGVVNADVITASTNPLVALSTTQLVMSALSNAGNINLTNNTTASATISDSMNLAVAGVAYFNSANNFTTNINGVYNLAYKYDKDWNSDTTSPSSMSVDIASISEFAPCLVSNATSISGVINAQNVYNLRNINFTQSKDLYFTDVNYSGCLSGEYYNLVNARNEGDLTFNMLVNAPRTLATTSGYKTFKIYGVFEEVSTGCSADTIFNGGDIKFYIGNSAYSNLNFIYNVSISGICYANRNQFASDSAYNLYNPLSTSYDKTKLGSLNNVINNGDLSSTNYSTETNTATYTYSTVVTTSITTTGYLRGYSKIAGICSVNESIITKTYNLGNITNRNYMVAQTGSYAYSTNFSIESGGLTYINVGKYAQIRDSANNGRIESINASAAEGMVHAAGITVKNDELENGNSITSSNLHHLQLICFTLNYGEIKAFSYSARINSNVDATEEPDTKSAGIICRGLSSILNTVNYGNVIGSEAVSGMFGVIQFYKFYSTVTTTAPVTIANSINYGAAKAISVILSPGGTPYPIAYSEVQDITATSTYLYLGNHTDKNYIGSLIAIINYASTASGTTAASTAGNISIRYLINFNDSRNIIDLEVATPTSILTAPETLISTKYPDTYMGNQITYAPLSSVEDALGNIGVFSENFKFQKAINGEIDSSVLTDKYIPDYFSFVAFSKINDTLLENIGWRTLAYSEAASNFSRDLTSLTNLLAEYKSVATTTDYQALVSTAINTESWLPYCSSQVLTALVEDMLANSNTAGLKSTIEFLFFESEYSSSISKATKTSVINLILNTLSSNHDDLVDLLDTLMYNDFLANVISKSDAEYEAIQTIISEGIDNLSTSELETLVETYLGYLNSGTVYNDFFTNDIGSSARAACLNSLLEGLPNEVLSGLVNSLDLSESSFKSQMTYALDSLTNSEKSTLYLSLITNNALTDADDNISIALKRFNISTYTEEADTTVLNAFNTALNNDYVDLWNAVKNDSNVQEYLNSILDTVTSETGSNHKGIIAKATEYTNAYQSNDSPSGTTGRVRALEKASALNTRYIYTPDSVVSNLTYFYGPYISSAGDTWNFSGNAADGTAVATPQNTGYNTKSYELSKNEVSSNGQAKQIYVPVFISLDEQYITELIAGTQNPTVYKFFWNNVPSSSASQCAQWVHENCITTAPANNQYALLKNYSYADTYYYNFNNVGSTTTTTEVNAGYALNGVSNNTSYTYQGVTAASKEFFLYSYCSASIITGIYYQQDQWDGKSSFMTAKNNQGIGVVTTSYIDYRMEDLLLLDGVRTKNTSSGASSDEIEIINSLMTTIMSTAKGKSVIMTACGDYLTSATSGTISSVTKAYMNALASDQTFINTFLDNTVYAPGTYTLSTNAAGTITYQDYINVIISGLTFTDKQKIVIACQDSQNNFITLINYLLDKDIGYYGFLSDASAFTWLASQNTDYLAKISEWINGSIDLGLTDAQISSYLSSVSETDVNNFISAYPLTTQTVADSGTYGDTITLGSNFENVISSVTYDGEYYGVALKSSTTSSTFTYNYSKVSTFNILASGSGTINMNGVTRTINGTGIYSFDSLNANQNYTVTVSSGVYIYNFEFVVSTNEMIAVDFTYNGWTLNDTSVTINNTAYTKALTGPSGTKFTFKQSSGGKKYLFIAATTGSSFTSYRTISSNTNVTGYNYRSANSYASGTTYTVTAGNDLDLYAFGINNTTGTSYTSNSYVITDMYSNTYTSGNYTYTFTDGVRNGTAVYGMPSTKAITATLTGTSVYLISSAASTITLTDSNGVAHQSTVTAGGTASFTECSLGAATITTSVTTNISSIQQIAPYNTTEDATPKTPNAVDFYNNYYSYLTSTSYSSNPFTNEIIASLQATQYQMFNANDTITGSFTNNFTDSNNKITGVVSNTNTMMCYASTSTIDGVSFTKLVDTVGAGSTSDRYFQFTISKNSKVFVFAKAAVSDSTIHLNVGGTDYAQTLYSATGHCYLYNASASSSTTCKLYTDSQAYIYEIFVVNEVNDLNTQFTTNYPWFSSIATTPNMLTANGGSFADYQTFSKVASRYASFKNTSRDLSSFNNSLDTANLSDKKALLNLFYGDTQADADLFTLLTDDEIRELITLASTKDTTIFREYMTYCNDDDILTNMILEICASNSDFYRELINNYVASTTLTESQKTLYTAAYIGADFGYQLDRSLLTSSSMITILDTLPNLTVNGTTFDPQFILGDDSMDNDTFLLLMQYLGFNLSTQGYGIYAVSSSEGILNGNFLPDNIDLPNIDSSYVSYNTSGTNYSYTDSTTGLTVVYNVLSDDETSEYASWRGGIMGNKNSITDTNSVNYAFYVSMKQLKLSIATNIFEIELVSTDGDYTLYTTDSLIDNKNKEVYFYLPSNGDGANATYMINTTSNYELSYEAVFSYDSDTYNGSNQNNYTTVNASTLNVGDDGTFTIYVYAEDRTVKATYTVHLIKTNNASLSLDKLYVNGSTTELAVSTPVNNVYTQNNAVVNSSDGSIKLALKTTNIANSTDFTDLVTIASEKYDGTNKYFSFNSNPYVTNSTFSAGTWSTGDLVLDLKINDNLPNGSNTIVIALGANIKCTVIFIKEVATGNSITEATFGGATVTFAYNSTTDTYDATSSILYGRGYNYEDLIYAQVPVYFDTFTISPCATVVATAAISLSNGTITNSTYTNGILTYTVTIVVTSESGVDKTYVHKLVEVDPFASAKEDTDYITTASGNYVSANYVTMYQNGVTLSPTVDNLGVVSTSYEREDENQNELTPKYRIQYNLDSFYSGTSDIVNYLSVNSSTTESSYLTTQAKYYGMQVNFFEDAFPDTYVFNLVYTNASINWSGSTTYSRSYISSNVEITKEKSTDAYLKKITFIEEAGKISQSATVASLSEVTASVGTNTYDNLKNDTQNVNNDVVANLDGISYNTTAAKNATEYYIVGTVNNASLTNYAPLFSIKSYSKIYQYIEADGVKYLYIEFVNITDSNDTVVFLVSEDYSTVYEASALWNYVYVADTPKPSVVSAYQEYITYNSKVYTLNTAVDGSYSKLNSALNMDYIGMPDDGYFWFVNYIVYAEAYEYGNASAQYYKEYHVAVLDLTNTVRFTLTINDLSTVKLTSGSLYVSIYCYVAFKNTEGGYYLYDSDDSKTYTNSDYDGSDSARALNCVISGFFTHDTTNNQYVLQDNLYGTDSLTMQTLPYSYYYFVLDLPDGYGCTYQVSTSGKENSSGQWLEDGVSDGSYLPPASIVTQNINITINITEQSGNKFAWGEKTLAVLPATAKKED